MQRIHRVIVGFCGLSCLLLLGAACGQNEGGRCQVNSDCASGLTCNEGPTGNGRCTAGTAVGKDAAATPDQASSSPDLTPAAPESGPEATPDLSESEAEPIDTGDEG
jgi:hypothetical protein